MRVIAGTARRLPLKALEGIETRPTQDRIKETLFNILQNDITDSIFVDVFSGSGAIGIEALSRGAKKAYFIENNSNACDIIKDNLLFTKLAERSIIKKQDAVMALSSLEDIKIDILFMDPPYDMELEKQVLLLLKRMPYLTEDTLIIIETSLKTDFSYLDSFGYELIKEKLYKTNKHVFLKRAGGCV